MLDIFVGGVFYTIFCKKKKYIVLEIRIWSRIKSVLAHS